MLAEKLPDTANLALGALVFGQFLASGFSWIAAVVGLALWLLFMAHSDSVRGRAEMNTGLWIIFGGLALFAIVITLIDIVGLRQERKEHGR